MSQRSIDMWKGFDRHKKKKIFVWFVSLVYTTNKKKITGCFLSFFFFHNWHSWTPSVYCTLKRKIAQHGHQTKRDFFFFFSQGTGKKERKKKKREEEEGGGRLAAVVIVHFNLFSICLPHTFFFFFTFFFLFLFLFLFRFLREQMTYMNTECITLSFRVRCFYSLRCCLSFLWRGGKKREERTKNEIHQRLTLSACAKVLS